MLRDLEHLGAIFTERFAKVKEWPEIKFNRMDKIHLKDVFKAFDIRAINDSSFEILIDNKNSCVIPSQYLAYAVFVKEFALCLKEYVEILDFLKTQDSDLADKIKNDDVDLSLLADLDAYSKSTFLNPFQNEKKRVSAKDIINSKKAGGYKFRGTIDFFGSVLLKVINVADNSTSILGKIIYCLTEHKEEYNYFEDRIIKNFPLLVSSKNYGTFVSQILNFYAQRDELSFFWESLKSNKASEENHSIKGDDFNLTSIIKTSNRPLTLAELSSGIKARWIQEPSYHDGLYHYISTEWTKGKESRLDVDSFISFMKLHQPSYIIESLGEELIFRKKKCSEYLSNHFKEVNNTTALSKPFLLLAGISGTGKTRFVREQAKEWLTDSKSEMKNYCLAPVRPDWHEPSDLLGYVSRIGSEGPRYIATDFLKFMVQAWLEAAEDIGGDNILLKPVDNITPFWLCLDEMNLAPVEQYFADYLSIIETRKWEDGTYTCDAILGSTIIKGLSEKNDKRGLDTLRADLFPKKNDEILTPLEESLWSHFQEHGISLPPNLIVAGTVNMDETTHGFSRKVIDRAMTIDFGEFFPNDFDVFSGKVNAPQVKTFTFPTESDAMKCEGLDPKLAEESIEFLKAVNTVLKGSPFELAYRALNELLLSVAACKDAKAEELQAIWDDFMMTKVLPRMDGDVDKMKCASNKENVASTYLDELAKVLENQFSVIWQEKKEEPSIKDPVENELKDEEKFSAPEPVKATGLRPDLFRLDENNKAIEILCRSKAKIQWMKGRLESNGFTSYWP